MQYQKFKRALTLAVGPLLVGYLEKRGLENIFLKATNEKNESSVPSGTHKNKGHE